MTWNEGAKGKTAQAPSKVKINELRCIDTTTDENDF